MTNKQVINKWYIGEDAKNSNMRSEDGKLFSYDLQIAHRSKSENGINAKWFHVFDYSIDTIEEFTGYRSMTTRQHIGLVIRTLSYTQRQFTIHNDKG